MQGEWLSVRFFVVAFSSFLSQIIIIGYIRHRHTHTSWTKLFVCLFIRIFYLFIFFSFVCKNRLIFATFISYQTIIDSLHALNVILKYFSSMYYYWFTLAPKCWSFDFPFQNWLDQMSDHAGACLIYIAPQRIKTNCGKGAYDLPSNIHSIQSRCSDLTLKRLFHLQKQLTYSFDIRCQFNSSY